MRRPGVEIVLERLDRPFRSLDKSFDAAVRKIFNVPADLVARRRTLGEIAKADTLNFAAYKELSCDHHLQTHRRFTRGRRDIPQAAAGGTCRSAFRAS